VASWRGSGRPFKVILAAAATLAIGGDFLLMAHQQWPLAFSVPADARWFPDPPVREIVNLGDGMGYPCVLRGYGLIRGYEPMLSYHRDAPTMRKARGEPGYRGEAWTADGEARPIFWSPNRIEFRVRPEEEVFINQNPGSWWRANGELASAGRRCAEPMVPFVARTDATGRLELRIDPPGLRAGLALQVVGAALLIAAWWRRRLDPDSGSV
jgi:hypothetical protein